MGFNILSELREGYVFLTAAGEVTEDSLVELGVTIRQACEKAGVNGTIVDAQAIEGALSPVHLFYATQKFVQAVGPRIKVAYINTPSHWKPADDQFSRTVAQNRGGSLEAFESEAEAVAWLAKKTL